MDKATAFLLGYVARFGDGEWGPRAQSLLDETRQQEIEPAAPAVEQTDNQPAPTEAKGKRKPAKGEEN